MLLRTLGGLALEGSSFQRPKPLLLLTYLALEGSKSRRHLADIFYAGTADPYNGLSRALSFLKEAVPETFETPGQRVAALIGCDAKSLLDELEAGHLEEGLTLYRGPFLDGFSLALGEELEEWVFTTREFLAARVREALLRDGERLLALGRPMAAARRADAAYVLEGAPELEPEDFQRTFELLIAGNHPRGAVVRSAAAGFGIPLQLPAKQPPHAPDAVTQTRHKLPQLKTSFVGRDEDLAELIGRLEDSECRLLTVLGPGGVGKSRLALEAARACLEKGTFPGGVYFLPLESLSSPHLVPARLADLLALDARGSADPLTLVEDALSDQHVLIVVDACEQLDGELSALTRLLTGCPNLKILATSRERLRLDEDWVYVLGGLATPEHEANLFRGGARAASLQLFAQRAKRARLQFSLTPDELPHVLRICQLVGGSPLGIELAAAWVSVMAPAEIEHELESDFALLEQEGPGGRPRSIRAVFESSWRRLNEEEQKVLRRLAVFFGGFRKTAAASVAGATTPILASLVDKSFLRLDGRGRYDRHALLYQYMRQKLAENPAEEVRARERHGRYYLQFLRDIESRLRGADAREATETIREELENLRLAWTWALERGEYDEIAGSAPSLRVFFDREGRFQEGAELFGQVIPVLESHSGGQHPALGIVLAEQAWLVFRLGRRETATNLAERGLALLQPAGHPRGLREGLHVLGALRLDAGRYGEARDMWGEALELAMAHGEAVDAAHSLELLALAEELAGNTEVAKARYRESLELSLRVGDKERTVDTLNNLAALLVDAGSLVEAEKLLHRGLKLAHELGTSRVTPYLTDNLAKVACERGDARRALALGQETLAMARESGEKPLETRALETLGRAALTLGDFGVAEEYYRKGLALSLSMNAVPLKVQLLLRVAELHAARGRDQQAASLLGLLEGQSTLTEAGRKALRAMCLKLERRLRHSVFEASVARGRASTLDTVVATIVDDGLL